MQIEKPSFLETKIEDKFFVLKSKNDSDRNILLKKEIDSSFIQFHFVIKGKSIFSFNNGAYKMDVSDGKYIILYNPKRNLPINSEISPKSYLLSVLISIKKFHKLFSEDSNNIIFLKDENINQKYYYENEISNRILLVLNELKRFDFNSSTKNLFVKAKIYELFSHLYSRNLDQNIEQCPFLNNEENFKKIQKAKNLVISNMTNPPTLIELSKEIDLSLKKLKEGFKKIYGKPVYQYLLEYKMELAKKLLTENSYNVNEVSIKLGYSTASHFITSFKNKYGLTPKNFKKNY